MACPIIPLQREFPENSAVQKQRITAFEGVVSLLDMLRFYADAFTRIAREIEKAYVAIDHLNDPSFNPDVPIEDKYIPDTKLIISQVQKVCSDTLLVSAYDQTNRILHQLDMPVRCTSRQLMNLLIDLQNRVDDGLARAVFYQLSPDRYHFYANTAPFGDHVNSRFPAAARDLHEAANCYAVHRNVATVYHLMKVMEVALRELAKKLKVRYSPSWGIYLERIDAKLKSKSPKSKAKRLRLQFLAEAASRLRAVKDAWRDPTMHVAADYGPDQTTAIFNSVKSFMEFLKDI